MDGETVIRGPGSYERYDEIAISCQKKYFRLFKLQILVLSLIAFLSLFPPFSETGTDIIKHSIELILIIVVLLIMIWQYYINYTKGWENARYLAESILSNAWLFVWKCEPFNGDDKIVSGKFIDIVENLEKLIDLGGFLAPVTPQKNGISDWMKNFRGDDLEMKRNNYIKYRLDDQIYWYNNKASHNQKRSELWFIAGLSLLGIGAILTIGVIVGYLPNWSFLGFFTTVSVSISSWFQAKRNDELKITYSVTAQELLRFRDRIDLISDENELTKLVEDIEKAISREHKLWLTHLMRFI